jgi:arabinogalactan endo-1,4-beta-galactosidase
MVSKRSKLLSLLTIAIFMAGLFGSNSENSGSLAATVVAPKLANGADVSWLPTIEQAGSKFSNATQKATDPLVLMKKAGLSVARVRLWVNPTTKHGSLTEVLALAKRIKSAGLDFVLDIHYSDWWADPGKQNKPSAWANLSQPSLVKKVHDYTVGVLKKFKGQKTIPVWVQIGNEVGNGLLWPNGQLDQWTPAKFTAMTSLLNAGTKATRETSPTTKVMIHLETGGDSVKTDGWLNNSFANGLVKPDAIGLSYYSQWGGPLSNLSDSIAVVATKWKLPVAVAETAYANTTVSTSHQVIDVTKAQLAGFALTSIGQAEYATAVCKLLRTTAGSKAIGVWWWEAFSPNTSKLSAQLEPSQIAISSLVDGFGRPNRAMTALGSAK